MKNLLILSFTLFFFTTSLNAALNEIGQGAVSDFERLK